MEESRAGRGTWPGCGACLLCTAARWPMRVLLAVAAWRAVEEQLPAKKSGRFVVGRGALVIQSARRLGLLSASDAKQPPHCARGEWDAPLEAPAQALRA